MEVAGTMAARILGSGLAVLTLATAGCEGAVYQGKEDVAAEAGSAQLPPDRLRSWVARVPSGQPTVAEAGFVALAWIDYSLLASAAARGEALTDSATAALALTPDLMLLPLRRWHDSLVARRPRIAADVPDSLYAGDNVRVFQQIVIRVSDPNDVRAITAVRERAETLLTKTRAPGANFAQLAQQYSEDPGAQQGGWLGPAPRSAFPPEFVRGSWRIKPGSINGVTSRVGFHIVRRPDLEEVRDRLRQYGESLATKRADSLYLDSLVAARGLALGRDVPARLRAFFNDPSVRTRDTEPLATWDGGDLRLAATSLWIDLLPPRTYLDLRGTSDVLLERYVRDLAKQYMLYDEANRDGIEVTPGEWATLQAGYRRSLAASLALLGVDSSGTLPSDQAGARVDSLLNRLTSDSARWRSLPSALGAVLRAKDGYRLHQRGLERAVRP
jgi:PPIC-type PPIASE domain